MMEMSFIFNVKKVSPFLVATARYSVLISMLKAWDNCRGRGNKPEEPDIVASLVLNGTKIIEDGWREIFNLFKIKIALTGIYCHQTPKINFKGMIGHSCELGDLLWCHVHTAKDGNIIRNAILYQAKKSSEHPYTICKEELDQFKLYSTWPEFTYVNSGKLLNGQMRHVKPSAPRRGAQYLLIEDHPPEWPESGIFGFPVIYPTGSCISSNPLIPHSDLGLELVRSLEYLSGDPFDDRIIAKNENGWSRVIWDILESSEKKAFRRVRSGYNNQPRRKGAEPSKMDGCFYTTSHKNFPSGKSILGDLIDGNHSNVGIPPHKQESELFDKNNSGVSILLLETYEVGE
ncbi:MAG: hypothetical protein IMZ52_05550 [Actinobacteria bacterium]|nr:hypothetical protein [Actinomycetota bacterium]MBE3114111.1 hypothetical protein [Actinomycetota bacterium]